MRSTAVEALLQLFDLLLHLPARLSKLGDEALLLTALNLKDGHLLLKPRLGAL